jgi:Arabinose efflux permease
MLGLFMVLPVLMLYGSNYTGATPFLLGVALGVYGLTQALFQIPMGLLSDLLGRKPVIIGGLIVFALGSVIAALSTSIEGLVFGRALQGCGAIASAIMAMVADLTSEQNRTKAMAAIGASIGLSFSVAMIVGPAVAAVAGLSGVFSLSAFLALLGIAVLLLVVPTPPRAAAASHRESGAIPALIISTAKNLDLLRLNWGIFSLHAVLMASFVAVPQLLEQSFTIARDDHWLVYLGMLVVAFILMLPFIIVAERKRKLKPVFVGAIAVLALSLILLAQAVNSVVYGLALLLVFFTAFNLLEASLPSLVSKLAPAGGKGTAMGLYSTSQFLGAFCGGACGGWLLQNYSLTVVFSAAGAFVLLWLLVATSMPRPRHLSSLCLPAGDSFPGTNVLLRVVGVEEALLAEDDGLIYLKVDKSVLDELELKKLVGG